MKKTKIIGNKKIEHNRMCDAVDVKLRDIIVKDLLTESEKKDYYGREKGKSLDKFNIYIDKTEADPSVKFNLSINGEPATDISSEFQMYILSGNSNEQGTDPILVTGSIVQKEPDTIVMFKMPIDESNNAFSYHRDGYSYANYALYAIIDAGSVNRLLMGKGRIIMTDVLFDLTESLGA